MSRNDSYAILEASRRKKYEAAYESEEAKAWRQSLSPAELERAEALGLLRAAHETDASSHSIETLSRKMQPQETMESEFDDHLISETRDALGRSTGFTYAKNGTVQHTVTTGYGSDGRISTAGFLHGGEAKNFGYTYLAGTNLLQGLSEPNGMTLSQTYEATRDLLTDIAYHRGSTLVARRTYTYDILGRPTARNTSRQGAVVNDTFVHNNRSELARATVNGADYDYDYDNIGNRRMSTESGDYLIYESNALNQYISISENGADTFVPQFDADGNQTLIKTETGIWTAVYNAENRPVTFTNSESNTVVECAYDSMGRRAYKKVTVDGSVTLHQRYIYRGYLQIACIDLTRSNHPALWFITWDPTQPIATRPLAIRKDGSWFTYGWDLTKNICEIFGPAGYLRTTYTYSPFGQVTASGDLTQPIQWSSEVWDGELGLVYYNWRYYNVTNSSWIIKDVIYELGGLNLSLYCKNAPINQYDILGRQWNSENGKKAIHELINYTEKNIEPCICKDILTSKGKYIDCITAVILVISCGYHLSNSREKSNSILKLKTKDADYLSNLLLSYNWKAVLYTKDTRKVTSTHDVARMIADGESRGTMIPLEDIAYMYGNSIKKKRIHFNESKINIPLSGLIPDLDPYENRASYKMPTESFAFISTTYGYHTGIYVDGLVYAYPDVSTNFSFIDFINEYYSSAVGWLMLPPDSQSNIHIYQNMMNNKEYIVYPQSSLIK